METYSSNSHKSREAAEKNVKPVVNGKTKISKNKSWFSDAIFQDSVSDLKMHIVKDVLAPILVRSISDIGHNIIEMIFGERYNSRERPITERYSYREPISYGSRYKSNNYRDDHDYDYNNIVFYSRTDANEVLKSLDDLIEVYHIASILDFYDLANRGNETRPTDNKYGWTDLRSARVVKVRDGWTIKFPKAMPIE